MILVGSKSDYMDLSWEMLGTVTSDVDANISLTGEQLLPSQGTRTRFKTCCKDWVL